MKINLTELANKVNEHHKDVECSFGEVRVYHVPEPFVWTLKPDWSVPSIPQKEMQLTTGQVQVRPARKDSKEYVEWQKEAERHEQETADIQLAARYVMALRDVEYPEDLSTPPPSIKDYVNGHYPENELLRKKTWLDATILARVADVTLIQATIMELNTADTVNSDDVNNVKKNSEFDTEEENSKIQKLEEVEVM